MTDSNTAMLADMTDTELMNLDHQASRWYDEGRDLLDRATTTWQAIRAERDRRQQTLLDDTAGMGGLFA